MIQGRDSYSDKIIKEDDVPGLLKNGSRVYIEQETGEPKALVNGLLKNADKFGEAKKVEIIITPISNINKTPFAEAEYSGCWRVLSFFGTPDLREPMKEKRVDYLPLKVSDIDKALRTNLKPDVAFVQVSAPAPSGLCSFGSTGKYHKTVVNSSSLVIAQVNSKVPFTSGNNTIHISEIDYVVEKDEPLLQVPFTEPGDLEKTIAELVASLVPNGATIQIGLGNIPNAILMALKEKKDLGIHSGLLSDGVVDLIESGAISGKYKAVDTYKIVASTLYGTDKLYNYCHNNPRIEVHPAYYTHNSSNMGKINHFLALNSAIEVDLLGQVNAETIKGTPVAGIGGQIDFAEGAQKSLGGFSVIALPSTVKGKKSRIVPYFANGTPVTTPRSIIDFVITEHGIADLRGISTARKSEELIKVAHPDFQDELKDWAKQL